MLELGSAELVTDTTTGLKGMLTHMQVEMDGVSRFYCFQQYGLNPETGSTLDVRWITQNRISGGTEVQEPDLPYHVLGTEVEDRGSGFKGVATAMQLHINGCVHFDVQPKTIFKTGMPTKAENLDYRRLRGPAIKDLTKKELVASHSTNPSPAPVTSYSPGTPKH